MGTLENAYHKAKKLPREKQNALAAMIRGEIDDEPLSYDNARTMLGVEQALKGEGMSRAECDARMEKVFAEIEKGK